MFLLAHTTTAVWLSRFIPNPLVAFVVSFVSHYVLDAIPHGDEKIFLDPHTGQLRLRKFIIVAAIDVALCCIWVPIMISWWHLPFWAAMAAAVASTLPDFLNGFYILTKTKWLRWNGQLTDAAHRLVLREPISPVTGIAVQVIFMALMIWLLSR